MTRNLGRISLAAIVVSYVLYYLGLLFGGFVDPSPFLRIATLTSVFLVLAATFAALYALAAGPQRVSAALGLLLGLVFFALLTGLFPFHWLH